MTAKQHKLFEQEPKGKKSAEELDSSETLAINQIYDFITNQPINDNPRERVLQAMAR